MFQDIPSVVIEGSSSKEAPHSAVHRRLISLREFLDLEVFWTFDSRIVDNLSIIPRDLGKEVAVTEFLSALAPELLNEDLFPMISDAKHLARASFDNHTVESAHVALKKQQIALKWKRKDLLLSDSIFSVTSQVFKSITREDAVEASRLTRQILGTAEGLSFEKDEGETGRWEAFASAGTKLASTYIVDFVVEEAGPRYLVVETSFGTMWNIEHQLCQFAYRVCLECKPSGTRERESYLLLISMLYLLTEISLDKALF